MSIRQVSVTRKSGASQGPAETDKASGKTSPHQLVEQARAAHALAWIQKAQANRQVDQQKLKSYTRRLPGMIQVNGFGQAMAFYYAKGSKENQDSDSIAYGTVHDLVKAWLCGPHDHEHTTGTPLYAAHAKAHPALLTAITSEDQQSYRRAQAETQALLRWAKKFAEALLKKEKVSE